MEEKINCSDCSVVLKNPSNYWSEDDKIYICDPCLEDRESEWKMRYIDALRQEK